jgi:hypothetical protein
MYICSSLCVHVHTFIRHTHARVCNIDADTNYTQARILTCVHTGFCQVHIDMHMLAIGDAQRHAGYLPRAVFDANFLLSCQ